jgi:hypothetical protein
VFLRNAYESSFEVEENAKAELTALKGQDALLSEQIAELEKQREKLKSRMTEPSEKLYLVKKKNPCADLPRHDEDGWFDDYDTCLERLLPDDLVLGAQAKDLGCPNYPGLSKDEKKATLSAVVNTNAFFFTRHKWKRLRGDLVGLFLTDDSKGNIPYAANPYIGLQTEVDRIIARARKGEPIYRSIKPESKAHLAKLLPANCNGSISPASSAKGSKKLDGSGTEVKGRN